MTSDSSKMLTRNELWRLQYRQRRYLKQANEDALSQRLKDVIGNLTTLSSDGRIGVLPIGPDGVQWMTLFTHLHEEYLLRGQQLPPRAGLHIPTPTAPGQPPPSAALNGILLPRPGQALVKLGKRAYMQDLFERGRIRIVPASSYSDPSLNHAIRDDELKLDRMMPGSETTITFWDEETSMPQHVKPIGDVTSTVSLATDYYVYCMTHNFSYRLFDDFEADACVIIGDPKAFHSCLQEKTRAKLPGWLDWCGPVHYIDPYLHHGRNVNLILSKHFRHWYQQEYRFAWIPAKGGRTDLEPIEVELGSLKEISELVFL